jgi:hypothetical protein
MSGSRCECGGDFKKDTNYDISDFGSATPKYSWKCNNCNAKKPRRVNTRKPGMTNSQKASVELVKEMLLSRNRPYTIVGDNYARPVYGAPNYEIKKCEITENHGHYYMVIEGGLIGDENTIASILCRDRFHIKLGAQGCHSSFFGRW